MKAIIRLLVAAAALLLLSAHAQAQTGGTTWANPKELTFTSPSDKITSTGSENYTIETVEYWDGTTWKKATFASSAVPAKSQTIDLGDEYVTGTVCRVLVRYYGSAVPTVDIKQGP